MNNRRIDFNALVWIVVLVGYGAFFAYLVFSGNLEFLVHPRMTPLVIFGFIALFVFAAFELRRIVRRGRGSRLKTGYVLFLIPFAFIPGSLGDNAVAVLSNGRGISLDQGQDTVDLTTKIQQAKNPFLPTADPVSRPAIPGIPASGTIELTKDTYYPVYNEMYDHAASYSGRTIEITGFVHHSADGKPDQFIAARELMWCCAADAITIGFICEGDQAAALKDDQWVRVTGTLSTTQYTDAFTHVVSTVPLVKITSIAPMSHADFAYVYPSS